MNYNYKSTTQRIFLKLRKFLTPLSIIIILMLALVTIVFSFKGCKYEYQKSEEVLNDTDTITMVISTEHTKFEDEVYSYILQLNIEHPDIVMAQCILESGNFTSDIYKKANNCLGMKVPKSRPTVCIGMYSSHARYKSWQECIIDYALWQSSYARGLTENEYFHYLDRVYSKTNEYSKLLKRIMKSKNL